MTEAANDTSATQAPPAPSLADAPNSGGLMTFSIAVIALALAGFALFKVHRVAGDTSCYRTIDMPKLTSVLINDLLQASSTLPAQEAKAMYREKFQALDAEVARHTGSCLLIRKDAVVLPDPDADITALVAGALGVKFGSQEAAIAAPAATAPEPGQGVTPAQQSTNGRENELGSKLD